MVNREDKFYKFPTTVHHFCHPKVKPGVLASNKTEKGCLMLPACVRTAASIATTTVCKWENSMKVLGVCHLLVHVPDIQHASSFASENTSV